MNILLVNGNYDGGGAAQVVKKLYYSYKERGIKVYFIAARDNVTRADCDVLYTSLLPIALHRIRISLYGNVCFHNIYIKKRIIDIIKKEKIDIVHFHNIANNYIGFEDLKDLTRHCKVFWTLHEFWSVTGHCYHPLNCRLWIEGECKNCPYLSRPNKLYYNNSHYIWKKKRDAFTKTNIQYIVPSEWMKAQLMKSFLKNEKINVIYNGINMEEYKELNCAFLRDKYKMPASKNILLFVSENLNNPSKGLPILKQALALINNKEQYCLVLVGDGDVNDCLDYIEIRQMGLVKNSRTMNEMFSLADILVMPSKAETFSLVAAESMASGTPVVTFRAGGVEEVVDENTGWVLEDRSAETLAEKIQLIFRNKSELVEKGKNCRGTVEQKFSLGKVVENHLDLYKELLSEV